MLATKMGTCKKMGQLHPWASTTIKIMVDPISMIETLRQAMVVVLTPIVLMVVGIPGSWFSCKDHVSSLATYATFPSVSRWNQRLNLQRFANTSLKLATILGGRFQNPHQRWGNGKFWMVPPSSSKTTRWSTSEAQSMIYAGFLRYERLP